MARKLPVIEATVRPKVGTIYSRRLRKAGRLPAVIYGHKQNPVHIACDEALMLDHLQRGARLLEVKLDSGATENCLIKDLQYDYLGTNVVHVDLARVDLTEQVEVDVAVEVRGQGESPGLKTAGAYLEQNLNRVRVRCLVTEIPDHVFADVSKLEMDQSMHAGEVALPPGVKLVTDPQAIIVGVHMAKEEEVVAEVVPTEAAQPEVITEKKPTEEEAAAEAKEGKEKEKKEKK